MEVHRPKPIHHWREFVKEVGIIVLGGAVNGPVSKARGEIVFDEGERMIEAAFLAKRRPE